MKTGAKISFWTAVLLGCEEVVDRGRGLGVGWWGEAGAGAGDGDGGLSIPENGVGEKRVVDAGGTVVASLATAGAFCLWSISIYSMPPPTEKIG